MKVLDLVIDAVAVARLTRLVTSDRVGVVVRDRVCEASYRRAGRTDELAAFAEVDGWAAVAAQDASAPPAAYLVTCRWCAGVWVAVAASAARTVSPRAWRTVARVSVLAWSAGIMGRVEGEAVR